MHSIKGNINIKVHLLPSRRVHIYSFYRTRVTQHGHGSLSLVGCPHGDCAIGVPTAEHCVIGVLTHYLQTTLACRELYHLLSQCHVKPAQISSLTLPSKKMSHSVFYHSIPVLCFFILTFCQWYQNKQNIDLIISVHRYLHQNKEGSDKGETPISGLCPAS